MVCDLTMLNKFPCFLFFEGWMVQNSVIFLKSFYGLSNGICYDHTTEFPTGVKNMGDEEALQNLRGGGGLESIHGGVWGA